MPINESIRRIQYVRENNNHPIKFDTQGNLVDQVTGETGTMLLPEITVQNYPYFSTFNQKAGEDLLRWAPGTGEMFDAVDIYNDFDKGNYLNAGIGITLFGLPNIIGTPLKRFIPKNLGRKFIDLIPDASQFNNFKQDITNFFRTPLNENPFRRVNRLRLLRNRWKSPKINVENVQVPNGTIINSQDDALELTRQRYLQGLDPDEPMFTIDGPFRQSRWNAIKEQEYFSLQDVYNINKRLSSDNSNIVKSFKSAWRTPIKYIKLNKLPGFAESDFNIVGINPKKLDKLNLKRLDAVRAHEYSHILDKNYTTPVKLLDLYDQAFNFKHLPVTAQDYLKGTELHARGTQLKNYFGFITPDQKLTGDMLKYAARHYSDDVFDNNMQQFFSGIKDWDAAAKYLNATSLKYGGKL